MMRWWSEKPPLATEPTRKEEKGDAEVKGTGFKERIQLCVSCTQPEQAALYVEETEHDKSGEKMGPERRVELDVNKVTDGHRRYRL